jgi:hypothetical protein
MDKVKAKKNKKINENNDNKENLKGINIVEPKDNVKTEKKN